MIDPIKLPLTFFGGATLSAELQGFEQFCGKIARRSRSLTVASRSWRRIGSIGCAANDDFISPP